MNVHYTVTFRLISEHFKFTRLWRMLNSSANCTPHKQHYCLFLYIESTTYSMKQTVVEHQRVFYSRAHFITVRSYFRYRCNDCSFSHCMWIILFHFLTRINLCYVNYFILDLCMHLCVICLYVIYVLLLGLYFFCSVR